MHNGFVTHREDLFQDRPQPETAYGHADTPSTAVGSSWPQGPAILAKDVQARLDALVDEVTSGDILVTVISVLSWEGTIVVLAGRTDTHDVTFACDPRAAAELQYRLDSEDEVLAMVEAWQLLTQRELAPKHSDLFDLWQADHQH